MCGRYTLHHSMEEITARFGVESVLQESPARYNIAPSQTVLAILQGEAHRLVRLQWGLVPFWSKEPSIGNRLINARVETLTEKPAFKYALSQRRCLVPADGFYEWKQDETGRTKQPMHIRRKDGALFAFAGLWEEWTPPGSDGPPLRTCTIITTTPNSLLATLHHRMAVILRSEDEAKWLDPALRDPAEILPLLQPYEDDVLEAFPIATKINTPAYDAPDCIEPINLETKPQQASLFSC